MAARIDQYIVKVHSRCDLACAHCYVYEHADQSWAAKPRRINTTVVRRAAERITEHAVGHEIPEVTIVLHGGEPLLLGHRHMRTVLTELDRVVRQVTTPRLHVQTNGVRLDTAFCELFAEFGVSVGVSLDGDRDANDRYRRFGSGRSSHTHVRAALALLRRYPRIYAGILCTVDVRNDPVLVYEALLAESPPAVDLLLPHATWDRPPFRPDGEGTPYADWLGRFHDRWLAESRPMPVRLFDSLSSLAAGGPSWTEAIGPDPVAMLTVETDGAWELADSLKTAYHGAPATDMTVFSHSADEASEHPGALARRTGRAGLSAECRACPVVNVCGGGLYAHRYRSASGFDNPSVYCADLKAFVKRTYPGKIRPPGASVQQSEMARALASGARTLDTWKGVQSAHAQIGRILIAKLVDALGDGPLGRAAKDGWELLCRLETRHESAVLEVLSYPFVQAWAARCLGSPQRADAEVDLAHLAGVAIAAAQRAGMAAELPLVVRDGGVHLPGIGAFEVDLPDGELRVVQTSEDGLALKDGVGRWHGLRRHTSRFLSPLIDDLDPFRGVADGPPPDGRLTEPAWAEWDLHLAAAGELLDRYLPDHRAVITEGLRAVVPQVHAPEGHHGSQTARHAFGAVSIAHPADPEILAELLLHEFQHVKLNGLLDLCDLHHRERKVMLTVPWRDEPRPVEAALHGAYAFLAVAEFWLARLREAEHPRFKERFTYVARQVGTVPEDLLECGALTGAGREFVLGLIERKNNWPTGRLTSYDTEPSRPKQ